MPNSCLSAVAAVVLVLAGQSVALAGVPYEPTGDELYDSYARLLLDRLEEADWNAAPMCWLTEENYGVISWLPGVDPGGPATQQPRLIGPREILDWETSFSADPRYWELRLLCVPTNYGEDGRERQRADLLQLDALCAAGRADEGAYTMLERFAVRLVDEGAGQIVEDVYLDIARRASAQYPDSGYWRYREGMVLIGLGEPEQALAALAAGNIAPRNAWAQAFPCNTLFDPRYSARQAEGNRIVRGVVYTQLSSNLPNFIRIKEAYKEACVILALGGDPGVADELLAMAGRIGQMEQITPVHQSVAAALPGVILDYVRTELLPNSAVEDQALLPYVEMKNLYGTAESGIAPNYPPYERNYQPAATPFVAAMLKGDAAAAAASPEAGLGVYADLPALQKADWLDFARDFDAGQARLAEKHDLFDWLATPPLARLLAGG